MRFELLIHFGLQRLIAVEKEGKVVQSIQARDSLEGPLLSNATRIGFACHVFCIGFGI